MNAATGVILCCCVLLFSFQLFSRLASHSTRPTFDLQASEAHTLHLIARATGAEQTESVGRITQENYKITPFFFQPVPINYSDQSLLMTIKGIGPSLAQQIIAAREHAGPFMNPEDLLRVNGIGPIRLQQFSPQLSFIRDLETH
ncbi:MAG: helix-hairpin-helix domain-containing protein [Proteobacteria bacterium]|nr:helix-hairpin-helix domain-containing protein [Pseudomonadota bacterium]